MDTLKIRVGVPNNYRDLKNTYFFLPLFLLAFLVLAGQPAQAIGKIIDVKKAPYNASGNGVSDDSAAIQQAINDAAASPGSTVFFPVGTYYHSSDLTVSGANTSLRGFNKVNTTLTGALVTLNSSGGSVSNLTFSGTPYTYQDYGSKRAITNCNFQSCPYWSGVTDVQISNCDVNTNQGESYGLYVGSSARVSVTNVSVRAGSSTPYLIWTEYSNDVAIRMAKVDSNNQYPINCNAGNRVSVETCTVKENGSAYAIVTAYSTNLTIRGNSVSGPSGSQSNVGIYSYDDRNVLWANNKVTNMNLGLYSYTSQVKMAANSVSSCGIGVYLYYPYDTQVTGNQIFNCQNDGILSYTYAGYKQIISGNAIKNIGLSSATAAIYVVNGGGTDVAIQTNTYTGNTQNVAYFIRCEVPSPPAVVKGNITTTMLPTQVGP